MVGDNGEAGAIRELRLFSGERIEDRFVPDTGSVPAIPTTGPLLVLTSHRIISFSEDDGDKHTSVAAVAELEGVSVKANTRGFRDLFQGLFLVVVGILTYIILGYILDGVTVALALGAAIAFVGILFMGKYLFWEEEGSVTFLAGAWETSVPYKNDRAIADLYRLIDRCFQLKLNTGEAPMVHETVVAVSEPATADPGTATTPLAQPRGELVVDANLTAVPFAPPREEPSVVHETVVATSEPPAADRYPATTPMAQPRGELIVDANLTAAPSAPAPFAPAREEPSVEAAPAPATLGTVQQEPERLPGATVERVEPAEEADQQAYRPWWAQSESSKNPSTPPPSSAA